MARARSSDRQPPSLHRTLSTPGLYLWRMFVFLVLVGLLVAVLHQQLWAAMLNNLGLNVLICFVLLAGVLYAFQQVLRLYPEVRWVNAFRIAAPLRGMGTAFSSSLLGLGGSLVLGFLELQASHAHGRFYNQLEEWLSGITELAPGVSHSSDFASHQLYEAVTEMHRAIADLG